MKIFPTKFHRNFPPEQLQMVTQALKTFGCLKIDFTIYKEIDVQSYDLTLLRKISKNMFANNK